MKTLRKFGTIRPSGQKVGLREDQDGEERLACIWIQSVSKQQGTVGAWLTVDEARVLVGWLRRFVFDHGRSKR